MIHHGKDPDPAVDPGPGHGGVGAPPPVGRLGDDRAVMGPRLAPATGPLWGEQASQAKQPQPPVAADLDAVLATQPGPDLAVALAGERRGEQHLADQLEQLAVADRGCRPRPDWLLGMTAGVQRGARRTEHPAHHGHW